MKLWLLIIFATVVQESASMTSAFYNASQQHFNLWIIHAMYAAATAVDIWLGYHVGGTINKHLLEGTRFEKWLKKHSRFLHKPGRQYLLVLTGIIDFPWLNGILGAWFELPFKLVFITTFIGDMISYAIFWGLTLGVVNFKFNAYLSVLVILVSAIIVTLLVEKVFSNKATRS